MCKCHPYSDISQKEQMRITEIRGINKQKERYELIKKEKNMYYRRVKASSE